MAKRTVALDTKEIEEIIKSLGNDSKIASKLERSLKTIKVRSAKAKGMSFQKDIAEVISGLTGIPVEKDGLIESRGSGQHGTDIILRGEARELFPYSPECKNQENLNLLDAISQAKENELPNTDWLIFHRRKTLKEDVVIMGLDAFIKLYREKAAARANKGTGRGEMTDDQTRRIRQLEDDNMSLLENVKDYDKIISILLNGIGGRFEISDCDLKSSPYRFGVVMEAENGPLIFKSFKKTEV